MPAMSPAVQLLIVVQLSILFGMFCAVALGLRELWAGRTLLAWSPARQVPWKGVDVLLVFLLYTMVNVGVVLGLASTLFVKPVAGAAGKKAELKKEAPKTAPKTVAAPPAPPAISFTSQMLMMTVTNVLLIAMIPLLLAWSSGTKLQDLGLSKENLTGNVWLGIRAFLFATPLVYVIFGLAQLVWPPNKHPLELMIMKELSPGAVGLAFLSAVILAPIAEELLFRSIFQGWLIRLFRARLRSDGRPHEPEVAPSTAAGPFSRSTVDPMTEVDDDLLDNPYASPASDLSGSAVSEPWIEITTRDQRPEWFAVVITSLLFALAHAPQMPAPVALFGLSVVLGVLINRTGSLIPSIVAHACFNGFSTLGLLVRAFAPES